MEVNSKHLTTLCEQQEGKGGPFPHSVVDRSSQFLNLPAEFILGDHILYSRDFSD